MRTRKYELVFEGADGAKYFPEYRRFHRTLKEAEEEAIRVGKVLDEHPIGSTAKASHNPQIYGPGLEDGVTVTW